MSNQNKPVNQDPQFIQLREQVAQRSIGEGRTDSNLTGLRYYKFSQSATQKKKQLLMPGIVVVLQGQKTAVLQHETLTYDELNYLVLSTGALCQGTLVNAEDNRPYLAIHLDLPIDLLVKTLTKLADYPTSTRPATNNNYVSALDLNLVNALYRLVCTSDSLTECQTIAPLILEEIIVRLLQSVDGHQFRDLPSISRTALRVQNSIEFMQTQLNRSLNIQALASQANMSNSHYSQMFREVTGTTPMRYLRDLRLENAKNLLLYKDMRTNEAAFHSGFESVEHFNRAFKQRYASTPTAFRLSTRPKSTF